MWFSSSVLKTREFCLSNKDGVGITEWDDRKDTLATALFHSAAGNPNVQLMDVVCIQPDKSTAALGTKKEDALHLAGV